MANTSQLTNTSMTKSKAVEDILDSLQKQLDASALGQSRREESPASRRLQRSGPFGLDIDNDLNKRIPLSTLQRVFTWGSDDEDVNDWTQKGCRPRPSKSRRDLSCGSRPDIDGV